MRARGIKPGFFKNEELGALQPICRILYIGLWCCADREGRLEDRPTRIKVEVLPYDECDIDVELSRLMDSKFINRYEVNGEKYIEILNFKKHQYPHVKESESFIPEPNKHKINTKRTRCLSGVNPPVLLTPVLLTPDSLLPMFEIFWKAYPRKIGKGYAKRIFLKVNPSNELFDTILKKIEILKQSEQWQSVKYIPHPATWLNREGWEDEVELPNDQYSHFEIVGAKNGKQD